MKKRLISLVVLLAMGTIIVSSCGQENNKPGDVTTNDNTSETTVPADDDPFEKDSLPELNFNGETINVLYREDVLDSFYAAEQTGEIVGDAVYKAVRATEDRIGVTITPITMAGTANADRENFVNAIANSVIAGDDSYDLCGVLTFNVPSLIQKGVLSNLMELPHVDFDRPWWTSDLTDLATVDGKLYMASGDISLELTQKIFCMLFDKKLAETVGAGDIYGIVSDGKWTLDKATEIAASAYSDLNGDGKVDPEDRFGMVINDYNQISGFIGSLDVKLGEKNTDGDWRYAGGNESTTEKMQKLVKTFKDIPGVFYMSKSDANPADVAENHEVYRSLFKNDQVLFISTEFNQIITNYRDMTSEYGVIPYPKYDEAQSDYYTIARNTYSSFTVPKTCQKQEAVGALMEALASQNYRSTSRTYFETALKVKYSHDDASSRMYDIIKNGLKFNFMFTYSGVAGNVANTFNDVVNKHNENWASESAKVEKSIDKALEKFYEDVRSQG